jgi:hypothetical protein
MCADTMAYIGTNICQLLAEYRWEHQNVKAWNLKAYQPLALLVVTERLRKESVVVHPRCWTTHGNEYR